MLTSQLTSTSGFCEPHLCEELLTALCAAEEGDNFFCIMGHIGKLSIDMEFVKVQQTILGISPLGVHVSLHFNEFHLAIVRTVIDYQVKRMSRQLYFNLVRTVETCL